MINALVSRRRLVLSNLLMLLFVILGFAGPMPNATAQYGNPMTEGGFKPFGTFDDSEIDSVNLANLELNLHIPLGPTYPQRGKMFSAGYHVIYTTNNVGIKSSYYYVPFAQVYPVNCSVSPADTTQLLDRTLNTGGLSIQADNEFGVPGGTTVGTADGATHEIAKAPSLGGYIALDGSGFFWNPSTFAITNSSGVVAHTSNDALRTTIGFSDLNATPNTMTLNAGGTAAKTDTIGRSLPDFSRIDGASPSPGPGWTPTTDFSHCTGSFTTVSAFTANFPSVYGNQTYKICYAAFYVADQTEMDYGQNDPGNTNNI